MRNLFPMKSKSGLTLRQYDSSATLIYETIFGLHRREHVTGKPALGWRRYLPQFFDPELAHRDEHKKDEEVYEETDANSVGA